MAAIVYLDVDDEITSAAARIRGSAETHVALVVPHGSRLGTSRINFRLLAREALARERTLGIVTPDPATRALATSAGLAAFASVGEYEGSLAAPAATSAPDESGPPDAEPSSPPAAAEAPADPPSPIPAADPTVVMPAVTPPSTTAPARKPATPADAPRDRDRPPRTIPGPPGALGAHGVAVAIVAVLAITLIAGGVAAYLLLPSATITITPRIEAVGPLPMSVLADPAVTEVDTTDGVIPATRISIEVETTDTFQATGRRVETERATGQVTFSSLNPAGSNTIPSGSIVSTEGGIRFRTLASVTLPPAQIIVGVPITIEPSTANVRVEAASEGPAGNVPPNAITVVPAGEDPNLTRVRNAAATEGGRRDEFTLVRQADVDAAVQRLRQDVEAQFEARLADAALVPAGATLFRETAVLGEPTPAPEPADLVGDEVDAFELTMVATGTVVAVDPSPVEAIARSRITSGVAGGYRLIEGSVEIDVGAPSVAGETVSYPVTARATRVRTVDGDVLLDAVKGQPIPRARAILEDFGVVTIAVWPDWVTSIPTLEDRVTLTVRPAAAPEPTGSPRPSGTAAPSSAGASAPVSPSPAPGSASPSGSP